MAEIIALSTLALLIAGSLAWARHRYPPATEPLVDASMLCCHRHSAHSVGIRAADPTRKQWQAAPASISARQGVPRPNDNWPPCSAARPARHCAPRDQSEP